MDWKLYLTYPLSALAMLAVGFVWAVFLRKRWAFLPWRIFWVGAGVFVLSQAVRLPVLFVLGKLLEPSAQTWSADFTHWFNLILLSFSAGLFEESARWVGFRFWLQQDRTYPRTLLYGAGHGGIEALILGLLVLLTYINMLILTQLDVATLVPAEQLSLVQSQMQAFWGANWWDTFAGAVERWLTVPFHIGLTVLGLQVWRRKAGWLWWLLAVLLHGTTNLVVVSVLPKLGYWGTEAVLAGFTLLAVLIIVIFREPEPETILAE
ncbi:MAG TPA: YhfC family glutamic-type intramembrane protease [Anaerolineales bacterium]|nr:YhfC family glutamic-type intramembrane protease [Anaerolineales bacterium]